MLIGGKGRDQLSGGNGADSFVYTAGMGRDVISDFDQSVDKIDLSGFAGAKNFSELQNLIGQGSNGAVVSLSVNDKFVIENVATSDLSADNFIF